MKETKIRAAPRLQFSEEELEVEGLKKPVLQVEKAAEKRDRMKARLRKEHGPKKKHRMHPRQMRPNRQRLASRLLPQHRKSLSCTGCALRKIR